MRGSSVGLTAFFIGQCVLAATALRAEDDAARDERHRRVSERREAVHVICHRGAVEFAHENTLEAYRATFALGADGNEIDVRATKDGVLVCFHDDMIDHLLAGYGDVADYTWDELQTIPFRDPGHFGAYCRIPTLREALLLHRDRAGLVYLDVKRSGISEGIAALLDECDMWDHIIYATPVFRDDRIRPTPVKASLYLDHSEVFADAIGDALEKPGLQVMVEDPRGVALALGRAVRVPDDQPVSDTIARWAQAADARPNDHRTVAELLAVLDDAAPPETGPDAGRLPNDRLAAWILARAQAADALVRRGTKNSEVFASLESQARNRTLHPDWRYCGLDGAAALRALIALRASQAVEVARFCLWRDDPGVEPFADPKYNNPRSWIDWRTKINVFGQLEGISGSASEQLCREYLKLSDDEARRIGIPQFEQAARTLLAVRPLDSTVNELLDHRLRAVRGRAVLYCLAHLDQPASREIVDRYLPGLVSEDTPAPPAGASPSSIEPAAK